MTDFSIPAVASAAFLGFLALAALLFCIPPVTRFLGDLFCCPWRLPFTRKKRRNDDEVLDKDDLPYAAEPPRPGSTVDDVEHQSTSGAHRPDGYAFGGESTADLVGDQVMRVHSPGYPPYPAQVNSPLHQVHPQPVNSPVIQHHVDGDFQHERHGSPHAPWRHSNLSGPLRNSWRAPGEDYTAYRSSASISYEAIPYYPQEHAHGYDVSQDLDIPRPQPSYPHPEVMSHQAQVGYHANKTHSPGAQDSSHRRYRGA